MSSAALLNHDNVLGQTDLIADSSFKAAVQSAMHDTRSQLDPQSEAYELLPPEETFDDANCQVISWIVEHAAGADEAKRKRGLQFTLATAADQLRADALLKRTSKVERARLRAVSAPHAAAWLRATPADAATRLSNRVYAAAIRQRLGLSHTDDTITGCACGKSSSKPGEKTFDPRPRSLVHQIQTSRCHISSRFGQGYLQQMAAPPECRLSNGVSLRARLAGKGRHHR